MTRKLTKIVATISDFRCDEDFIRSLMEAGVNVVRLNTAHTTFEGMDHVIENVRRVSPYIGILVDTKGPEIRTTKTEAPILFTTGQYVDIIGDNEGLTTAETIFVSYEKIHEDAPLGCHILIDDGELELEVLEIGEKVLHCRCLNDGELGSRKSLNLPGCRIQLPAVTERDRDFILHAIEKDVDFIAHSFVRSKHDVIAVKQILDEHNSQIAIISKIENQEGVDNIDEILQVSNGIMIARGDLGIEVQIEKIPAIQRLIIRKCIERKKPVIVATQMLHSMIKAPRPTRAEVSDVANAIYYRTDAVMLSGETAYGKYPIETVATMSRIIGEAEKSRTTANDIRVPIEGDDLTTTSFLAKQAVKSVSKLNVRALIADSYTGRTARHLAAFRGTVPIYAVCYVQRTTRELSLSYGVWTEYVPLETGKHQNLIGALEKLIKAGMLTMEDRVAHMSGNVGAEGSTTKLEIETVRRLMIKYASGEEN